MILVRLGEYGRDLTLAEGVVKRIVDILRSDAEARSRIAIDVEHQSESIALLIARDIPELVDSLKFGEEPGPLCSVR